MSFLKYFLSIEALFTGGDNPTHSLASRAASINTFSGYGIFTQSRIDIEYRYIKSLCTKRLNIIHRGMNATEDDVISANQVQYLCRIAAFSILGVLFMNVNGFVDMAQVRRQIDRLYSGPHA